MANFTIIFAGSSIFTIEVFYSEHSTSSGVLLSFVFITDSGDVDFSRSFLLALDRNTSHNHTLPFDLYPGHYRVYVYGIEHDGTLHHGVGYPAVMEELFTSLSNGIATVDRVYCSAIAQTCLQPFDCTVTSSSGLIWALCSHPDSSFAAGIQVIVQSTNVSEVHKLYVNQSMDLHTPVTVSVERDGEYQVSIYAIREVTGILDSSVHYRGVTVTRQSVTSTTTISGQDISTSKGIIVPTNTVLLLFCVGKDFTSTCERTIKMYYRISISMYKFEGIHASK